MQRHPIALATVALSGAASADESSPPWEVATAHETLTEVLPAIERDRGRVASAGDRSR